MSLTLSHGTFLPLLALVTYLPLQANGCGEATPTPAPTPYPDDMGYTCDVSFPSLPSPPTARSSFMALPTSNGYISATYAQLLEQIPVRYADGTSGTFSPRHRLITFTEHLMHQPAPSTYTRDLMYDSYFGVRINGTGLWLGDVPEEQAEYVPGTGIIQLVQHVGTVRIDTYLFAPFHGESYALVGLARVTNEGSSPSAVDVYALANFHAGGEGQASNESVALRAASGVDESSPLGPSGPTRLYYRGIETPSHRSAAPAGNSAHNPYPLLQSGKNLSDSAISGNDVAAGLQWTLSDGSLDPGESAWAGWVIGLNGNSESADALAARVDAFVASRGSEQLLVAEQSFWDSYHSLEVLPTGITSDEAAVYRQSTAILKMGQVREPGRAYGQLVAGLPPGMWNISWPRDAAYAIVGLVYSGHLSEAEAALAFMIQGEAGRYASWLGISDYLISVCRYYGDGTEESDGATCPDGSDAGLNIELDDFGLFLWAYDTYLAQAGAGAFRQNTLPLVLEGVATPLTQLIDPTVQLLVADSSIWERHWNGCFPNGRKHFTYSSLQAVNGLRRMATQGDAPEYQTAAQQLKGGLLSMAGGPVLEEVFEGQTCPVLASAPEEICSYCGPYDASVIDAINQGVIRPESALARGTLRALLAHLRMSNGSPGFKRADDGTGTSNPYPWYDDQEWVVIDLRMASAMATMGAALQSPVLTQNARTLLDWITQLARANHNLIGELLSDGVYTADDDADGFNHGKDGGSELQGSVPMCGFGPGAYIQALHTWYGAGQGLAAQRR